MFEIPVLARFLATGIAREGYRRDFIGQPVEPAGRASPAQASRSSTQMMQLVRDEHGLVASMVKAQVAAQAQPTAPSMGANRDRTAGDHHRVATRSASH
jgi:hypothetical protein